MNRSHFDSTRAHHGVGRGFLALFLAAMIGLTGCGLVRGLQEPPEDNDSEQSEDNDSEQETNDCGGDEQLTYLGEPADVSDPCGPCDRDRLDCDDGDPESNTLECIPGGTRCEAPAALTADGSVDAVELSWPHVDGAEEYVLRRDGEVIEQRQVDNNVLPGDQLTYTDNEAEPGRPHNPTDFTVDDEGDISDIRLVWQAPQDGATTDHDYELVAVHQGVEIPESEPVTASEGRPVGNVSRYDYRWSVGEEEGAWTEGISSSTSEGFVFTHLTEAEQWPLVEIGSLNATDGDAGWNVDVHLEDVVATIFTTEFEVRGVTEAGVVGESTTASWTPPIDDFEIWWKRALADGENDPEDSDFEVLDTQTWSAVELEGEEQQFGPDENADLDLTDTIPKSANPYLYQAEVTLGGYDAFDDFDEREDRVEATAGDTGFRAEPLVHTAASNATVKRISARGVEEAKYDPFERQVSAVATTPDNTVYAAEGFGLVTTIHKIDPGGTISAKVNAHAARVHDLAICPDGHIISVDDDGEVIKSDSNGDEINRKHIDTDHLSVAVTEDCDVFVASTDGVVRQVDHFDNTPEVVWQFPEEGEGEELYSIFGDTAVATAPDETIYWGSGEGTLYRLEPGEGVIGNVDLPEPDVSGDDWYGGIEPVVDRQITDLAVDHEGRVVVSAYETRFTQGIYIKRGYLYVYEFGEEGGPVTPHLEMMHLHTRGDDPEDDIFESAKISAVEVDPLGNIYYSTWWPTEKVYKLPPLSELTSGQTSESWAFDEYTTPNPDPLGDEFCDDVDEEDFEGDYDCIDVHDIAVGPGSYGAFPDAWHDIREQLNGGEESGQ